MEIKTRWRLEPEPYYVFEIFIENGFVILKEWWDPGHDPNTSFAELAKFEGSPLANQLIYRLGEGVYSEVLANVKKIGGL